MGPVLTDAAKSKPLWGVLLGLFQSQLPYRKDSSLPARNAHVDFSLLTSPEAVSKKKGKLLEDTGS